MLNIKKNTPGGVLLKSTEVLKSTFNQCEDFIFKKFD